MTDDPARPALRASDADRERVSDVLGRHAAAGRLTVDELSDRTDAAYAATTLDELKTLTADLPPDEPEVKADAPVPEEAALRRGFRTHLASYGLVMVLLLAIWALTGADYFWPVWPALGWGIGVAADFLRTRGEIAEIRSARPEDRAMVAARSAERRAAHHHHHHHGPHALPHPPRPPGPPRP